MNKGTFPNWFFWSHILTWYQNKYKWNIKKTIRKPSPETQKMIHQTQWHVPLEWKLVNILHYTVLLEFQETNKTLLS